MKYRLSKKARQILSHLKTTITPLSSSSIAKSLALRDETVRSLLESLRQQKLIEDYETTQTEYYQLTTEGKQFATKGLPEIRLVKILTKQGGEGSVISVANDKTLELSEQQLALGWARRNGWITVSKRNGQTWMKLKSNAMKAVKQHLLQRALNVASKSGRLQHENMSIDVKEWTAIQRDLIKRSLAELVTHQSVSVIITSEGNQALETSLAQKDLIQDLSPEIIKSEAWKDQTFLP